MLPYDGEVAALGWPELELVPALSEKPTRAEEQFRQSNAPARRRREGGHSGYMSGLGEGAHRDRHAPAGGTTDLIKKDVPSLRRQEAEGRCGARDGEPQARWCGGGGGWKPCPPEGHGRSHPFSSHRSARPNVLCCLALAFVVQAAGIEQTILCGLVEFAEKIQWII